MPGGDAVHVIVDAAPGPAGDGADSGRKVGSRSAADGQLLQLTAGRVLANSTVSSGVSTSRPTPPSSLAVAPASRAARRRPPATASASDAAKRTSAGVK